MNTIRRLLFVLLIVVLSAAVLVMPVHAANIMQDGLLITLDTDKKTYERGESITATLSVKNTGSAIVKDVSMEQYAPEGFAVAVNSDTTALQKKLNSGETATLTASYTAKASAAATVETDIEVAAIAGTAEDAVKNDVREEATAKNKSIKTILLVLIGTAIVALIVLILILTGLWKKILCLFLCICTLSSLLPAVPLQTKAAQADTKTAKVSTNVNVVGEEIRLEATVTYQISEEEDTVTVTFSTNYGSSIASKTIGKGDRVSQPANPTRAGYSFLGWYSDKSLTKKYNFMDPVTEDMVLYAGWKKNAATEDDSDSTTAANRDDDSDSTSTTNPAGTCVVTFEANGGSTIPASVVEKNKPMAEPTAPTRENYKFVGWFTDKALTKAYDFSTAVRVDMILYAKWVLISNLHIAVTNSGYQADTKSILTHEDEITLTGTITGVGEIQEAKASYRSYGTEDAAAQLTGTDSWSCQVPLEIGTNTFTISVTATDGAVAETTVYVNRLSQEVAYSDTVKVLDPQDYQTAYDDIVGCWCDDNGTEQVSDDTIVMLVYDDALLLDQIDDQLIVVGDLYMIPDNNLFPVGFSGVYKLHRAPDGCEDYPAEEYPDSEYEEVVFDYPSFADLFGDDVSLDFSSGFDREDPIAFVLAGDGTPIGGAATFSMRSTPVTYANTYYPKPGWQLQELLSNLAPTISPKVDQYGRLSLQLKWDDIVIYDHDAKKNPDSGLDKDKGQLKLSGEFGITNLTYTGGIEWHPSLVPWDIELLPQQIISKMEYTQGGGLTLKGGTTVSTSGLVKDYNHYKNQKEFWGMKVNGVKTFESRMALCIVGVNLAPFSLKPYKTLKGLASASTQTTPKLFIYIFIDLDGNITVEGSVNMKYTTDIVKGYNVQKNGYTGSYGSQAQNRSDKHYKIGSTHTLDVYDSSDNNGGLHLTMGGKFEAGLDIGAGAGAGLMICGVCPATVDGEIFYRANGKAEGELQFLPELDLDGYAGLYHGVGRQVDMAARVILKTKIGDAGIDKNLHFERMFWEETRSTSKFEGTIYVSDDDGDNSNNAVVSGATVTLIKKDTRELWSTTSDTNGKYTLGSMPDGEYILQVEMTGYDLYKNESVIFEKEKKLDIFLNEYDPWDGICTLSGKIVIADTDTNMANNKPLSGATIELRNNRNNATTSTTTASDGTYKITNIPAGNYTITISKTGYISIFAAVSVADNTQNYYNATLEAISEDYTGDGTASGTIYDALNGHAVSGLTLNFRGGVGTSSGVIVQTVTTNAQGNYTTPLMPAGNYTAEIVDERQLDSENSRYMTSTFTVKILGNQTIPNQDGYVTNGLLPDQLRVVLKWGSSPRDLDSHMVGPSGSGGRFHTYFSAKNHYDSSKLMANLDLDDTSSYGPETTTIYETAPGIYTFLVHDYTNRYSSGSKSMANSGAYVEVYLGVSNVVAKRFDVPNEAGTLWTVFRYNANTGEIIPVNTMSNYSAPQSIGSGIPVWETMLAMFGLPKEETVEEDLPLKDYELEENQAEQDNPPSEPSGDVPADSSQQEAPQSDNTENSNVPEEDATENYEPSEEEGDDTTGTVYTQSVLPEDASANSVQVEEDPISPLSQENDVEKGTETDSSEDAETGTESETA